MWRTVSFVERIEVEFKGTLFNQALILADVDNDEKNELIVGNVDGDLAIFKGSNPEAWRRSADLGMITCMGVGDFCNQGKNVLVCLTAEGSCYVFDIKAEGEIPISGDEKILRPAFKQELPANGKVLLLADAVGDGKIELIVGYSDRVVRTFRWQAGVDSDNYSLGHIVAVQKWQLAGQTESITVNKSLHGEPQLMASQPGGTLVTLLPHIRGSNPSTPKYKEGGAGGTHPTSKSLAKGNNSLSLKSKEMNSGGTLITSVQHVKGSSPSTPKSKESNSLSDPVKDLKASDIQHHTPSKCQTHGITHENSDTFLLYHPLGLSRAKNRDISTVIVGGIKPGRTGDIDNNSHQTYYAVATLDGNLVLAENDKILWSLQVDHQLFSLCKLDVTGNGQEEVICCSWDGQTYIVNQSREVVRYLFQENVAAFCAGLYNLDENGNRPCFVYATFTGIIYIYHNINLPRVESTNLIQVMDQIPETRKLLEELNINPNRKDQLRELYHWILYGWKAKR